MSDTNQAVQSQHKARSLKRWIYGEEEYSIPMGKIKALISCAVTASASLFSHNMQIVGFLM